MKEIPPTNTRMRRTGQRIGTSRPLRNVPRRLLNGAGRVNRVSCSETNTFKGIHCPARERRKNRSSSASGRLNPCDISSYLYTISEARIGRVHHIFPTLF